MELKIWEETILAWVNSLGLSYNISQFENINLEIIQDIINLVDTCSDRNVVDFVNKYFPNYIIRDKTFTSVTHYDYLSMCTIILLFICYTTKEELEPVKQKMCLKLENSVQEYLTDFLVHAQKLGDVFSATSEAIRDEIIKFSSRNPMQNLVTDVLATPVKLGNKSFSSDSPLFEFLQTPKRKSGNRRSSSSGSYNKNDQLKKIKELTDQLVEEELEKASLQEKLKWHQIKCSDYESKLQSKIEELQQLKSEWQQDMMNNENELTRLQCTIERNKEERDRLCRELSFLEKYVSSLEEELNQKTNEKKDLEEQVKATLKRCEIYDEEVNRLSKINSAFESTIKNNEAELNALKENCINTYRGDGLEESFCPSEQLDATVMVPEHMDIVIEKILRERTSENESLKETIMEMKLEKEALSNEITCLKSHLSSKTTENAETRELNKQLIQKIDSFVLSCKELQGVQSQIADHLKNMNEVKLSEFDSKELHVIYDCPRDLTESASQLSLEGSDATHLTTIMESLNESDGSSQCGSVATTTEGDKCTRAQFQLEELNQQILTAKKSLITFLKASMKNFEVLKIKENLLNEMSKQHEHLESRITSLTELNAKLTKEVMNSQNITQIDSEFREKELGSLKLEVESLKKASQLLREKLLDLEKTNEVLASKKEECLSELALLRKRNKSLNNDLQNRVMLQLKQQNSCLGFIHSKKETELELEKTMKLKESIDKKFMELRKTLRNHDNRIALEMLLNTTEQKFSVASQNLLHITYSCLKWSAKSMEHQCYLIGQGDNLPETDLCEDTLKKEQEENKRELKNVLNVLNELVDNLNALESKSNETIDFSDSLEIIQPANKTFDIISLDEKQINEITFSIKKEEIKLSQKNSTWVISPPSKAVRQNNAQKDDKLTKGNFWVVPIAAPEPKTKPKPKQSEVLKIKSSYMSAISSVEYSPPSKPDPKTNSIVSFISASEPETVSEDERKEDISKADENLAEKQDLEMKISKFQKEIFHLVEENDRLRQLLAECEEKRKRDKEKCEKDQDFIRQSITSKYESQLEHLKSEMKSLYNQELIKHKAEQTKITFELKEQNKVYKNHIDELRSQLWDLGEKLLHEQKVKRDLERNLEEMKKKLSRFSFSMEIESGTSQDSEFIKKERFHDDNLPSTYLKHLGSSSFPTIPTEDEDEIFDNRCLEDVKNGICKVEGPEGRLTELQYRNSLCLPHLKSSYPAETQFQNPKLFGENDLKFGTLNFGQESHSLTDSDHSMTKSLLPDEKVKKKEQTSYKKPGPPTPGKNSGRHSIQSGDFHMTPRKVLRENVDLHNRKGTPSRLKDLFSSRTVKKESLGCKDENGVTVTSRGKRHKFFTSVKPFGGRDY